MLGILVSALVLGLVVPLIFGRLETIYYFDLTSGFVSEAAVQGRKINEFKRAY